MSLDSKAARWSIPGVARPFMRSTFPDTAKGQAWRQSVGLTFAGNLLSITTVTPLTEGLLVHQVVFRTRVLPAVVYGDDGPQVTYRPSVRIPIGG